MYKFSFQNFKSTIQYEVLIKEFLQPGEYQLGDFHASKGAFVLNTKTDKEEIKRQIYNYLSQATGKRPLWGILTGIRPVKLAGDIGDTGQDAKKVLMNKYLVHESKANLTMEILNYQRDLVGRPTPTSLSVYIGIPFCPTRCMYCSFTSNQVPDDEIERYLKSLHKEIAFTGEQAKDFGYTVESVYCGGGTPTTLSAKQLDALLNKVYSSFDLEHRPELTVEAGRPDTITEDKLKILKEYGVNRISINPQSMKQDTLDLIGRKHTVKDVYNAFELAHKIGFEVINTDLIAGLPKETAVDFEKSLNEITKLQANNITVHTLAVKRASRLKEIDENFNYKDEELREKMLEFANITLRSEGYIPYYLYRQKHTSGNTENIGFCLNDKACTYNIRIMEEAQSILALGAGGISKRYFPSEHRLERVANISNYELYIDRIDEMLSRKNKEFFIT